MRPSMRADRMSCCSNLLEDFRVPHRMFADGEEQRLGALRLQGFEDGWRIAGPRTVIEGQHDFVVAKEVVCFKLLGSEAGASGRVYFHSPRHAKRVWIGRTFCGCRDR